MHLNNGTWDPHDVLANCPEGEGVDDYLRREGWEVFLAVGADNHHDSMALRTWRRYTGEGDQRRAQYLLNIEDIDVFSDYLVIESLPELFDLMARWTPIVQATHMVRVLDDISGTGINRDGLVELTGARVRYGMEEGYDTARARLRERDAMWRLRQQERQAERAKANGGGQ